MTKTVVFDTSSMVSASLRPDSIPDKALTRALTHCVLCTSDEHLVELEEVLRRKRFNAYVDLDSRLRLFAAIRAHAVLCTVPEPVLEDVRGNCRDARDEFLLAPALAAEADVIVSSDRDLLVLHPWRGIPIVTPAQFLEMK